MLIGARGAWADDAYYTLDTTNSKNETTNNGYAASGTVTVGGIGWTFEGNGKIEPWRLGGKSITKIDRTAYTTTAMGAAISKVDLTVGEASSITVNSLKLVVASDASFNKVIDEVSKTFKASSTITFTPTSGDSWAEKAYYKFVFNVTVSGSSNKFVEFKKVEFYAAAADVSVTGVSLNKTSTSLVVGGTETLTATVAPDDATNKNVTWASSDENVATVVDGVVTAIAAGTTDITVTTEDGSYTATCKVTVTAGAVAVTGVSLNKETTTLLVGGGVETLTATIAPDDATNKNVIWASSDETVATVDESGKVTAVGVGTANITVTTVDGGKTATCAVTVNPVVVESVSLNKTETSITVSATETLTATITPDNATNKNVTWTSNDESVATVDGGVVTGVAVGTATITVTTTDGSKTATCAVTVAAAPSEETITFSELEYANAAEVTTVNGTNATLTFDKGTNSNAPKYYTSGTALRMYGGNTMTVTATKTIKKIELTFGSSDGSNTITTDVDTYSDGTWLGSAKSVTFTIGGSTGNRRLSSVKITYAPEGPAVNVTGVSLKESTTLYVGGTETLTAIITPDNATNKNVTWTSSNEAVATVSNGVVTAVAVGTATITVTTVDGSKTATCSVTVTAAPGSEARPYTVAEAIAAIDAGTGAGVTGVYATGIVSEIVTAYSSQYGNISYNISADGLTTSAQLQAYRGKSYNGVNFTSEDDIQVGDVVVIYGDLQKYGSTYEFGAGNSLVSLVRKAVAGLSYETTSYNANLGSAFATPELTNPHDLAVNYSSSNTGVATVDAETGAVTLVAAGETTITATFAGNASYQAGSASYTLTVIDPSEPVDICVLNSITPTTLTVGDMGDFVLSADFVDGVVEDDDYEISWSSSDSDILEVAGTTYEAKAAGKVTVTVRVEVLDEDIYNNVEKAFEVTVKAPKTYVALVAEYDGKFYALNSTFSSNTFSATVVNIVNHKVINGQTDAVSWLVTETDGMATILNKDECTYVGFSGKNLTTSESDWTVDNTNSTWNTGANRTILYRESANGFKNYATSNVNSSDYSGYTTAYTFADGYTREVTGGNFGTICLPYDVAADDFCGVNFYQIAAKTMNGEKLKSVTLEEVTELVGGAAYLFQADEEATKLVAAYSGSEADEEIPADVSGTGLTGTYAKQYIPKGMYMLKNGKLYYVDAENYVYSGVNKAYIDLTDVPEAGANVKGIELFSGDLETGIQSVGDETTERVVYNLSGQRVQKPVRGVYVVNGQKIVVK